MFWTIFLATVPMGLALFAGFALSVRNFSRHGQSARIAVIGYLLILLAFTSQTAFLILLMASPKPTEFWQGLYRVTHTAGFWTQYTTPVLGFALLTWAAFAGRRPTDDGGAA
jgi:cytosine/uracil/thiamine/allantoin permease